MKGVSHLWHHQYNEGGGVASQLFNTHGPLFLKIGSYAEEVWYEQGNGCGL